MALPKNHAVDCLEVPPAALKITLQISRRQALQCGVALSVGMTSCLSAAAQSASAQSPTHLQRNHPHWRVAQILDMSAAQHDVSRDFLIGSRLGWQSVQQSWQAQKVEIEHWVLETDGSAASVHAATQSALADPQCIALSGCAGDALARQVTQHVLQAPSQDTLPMLAPWLMGSPSLAAAKNTAWVFAGYLTQISHTLRSMAVLGIRELGVAYGSTQHRLAFRDEIANAAHAWAVELQEVSRNSAIPAMTLFMGGTPELLHFIQQTRFAPGRQYYLLALADVNLQTLQESGLLPAQVSVIAAHPVPRPQTALPLAQAYRTALNQNYDELPNAIGLAGFVAARYSAALLSQRPVTQWSRAEFNQRISHRTAFVLDGISIPGSAQKPLSGYVTQSMLSRDRRVIG